jgi:hypothetical protein
VLLVFGAPRQLRLLAGQEHGRTIPLPDIERPAEAVISPLSFEGCTLFGFELAISPSTAVHHSGFKIKAICTNRPRPSYFYTLGPDF